MLSRFSRVQLFATLWTVAHQSPLSMGLSRQGYCSGLPCPVPQDLPDPGIESVSPALQADSLPLSHWGRPNLTLHTQFFFQGLCFKIYFISHTVFTRFFIKIIYNIKIKQISIFQPKKKYLFQLDLVLVICSF